VPARSDPSLAGTAILRAAFIVVALVAFYGAGWLSLAPNRLLPGEPVSGLQAMGPILLATALLVLAGGLIPPGRSRFAGPALLFAAVALGLIGTGLAAREFLQGRPPAARVMLGPGFWLGMGAVLALLAEQARATGLSWVRPATIVAVSALILIGAATGLFDSLSLMVEYRARFPEIQAAIGQHLALSVGALALALMLAVPLGLLSLKFPRLEAASHAVLAVVQVTPAIALFGLLLPLLSAILGFMPALRGFGLAAIGPVPALIGVAVYLALPLLRGIVSGLRATDPAVVEAAQAMGMTDLRTTWDIRIPLGLPILMAALRVAAVQSIGLTTLGGLIGAGGLGAIVFTGMSQFAADLIILGSIPIVLLALAVDGGLGWACRALEGPGL
jgi:osmoprotectant transport system permease protein